VVDAVNNRIFIYPDALLADFYIEMSDPQKQCVARWRLSRVSHDLGTLTDQSPVVVAFGVDNVFYRSSALLQHSETCIQNIVAVDKGWISVMVAMLGGVHCFCRPGKATSKPTWLMSRHIRAVRGGVPCGSGEVGVVVRRADPL